jgi:hypothetical protein
MVVFGWNQIWSSFGFDLNFKFSRAHSSASYFILWCALLSAACCCFLLHAARLPHGKRLVAVTSSPRHAAPVLHHAAASSHHWPLPHMCLGHLSELQVSSGRQSPSHATVRLHFSLPERAHALVFYAAELTSPLPHRYTTPEQPPRGSMEVC